jgi:hypothetical protein
VESKKVKLRIREKNDGYQGLDSGGGGKMLVIGYKV